MSGTVDAMKLNTTPAPHDGAALQAGSKAEIPLVAVASKVPLSTKPASAVVRKTADEAVVRKTAEVPAAVSSKTSSRDDEKKGSGEQVDEKLEDVLVNDLADELDEFVNIQSGETLEDYIYRSHRPVKKRRDRQGRPIKHDFHPEDSEPKLVGHRRVNKSCLKKPVNNLWIMIVILLNLTMRLVVVDEQQTVETTNKELLLWKQLLVRTVSVIRWKRSPPGVRRRSWWSRKLTRMATLVRTPQEALLSLLLFCADWKISRRR
jgi:hypothetical protein